MLTEYRHRSSQFQSALAREKYLFFSGQKAQPGTAHLYADNSDLFSRETIAELKEALAGISAYRETDRAAIHHLIVFATKGRLTLHVREQSAEIAADEAAATITWQDQILSFHEAFARLDSEPIARRRRELYVRCSEVISRIQDVRAERLSRWHESARACGSANYLTLSRELRGVDYEQLAMRANAFLATTESRYVSVLAPLLIRDAQITLDEAHRADLGWLQKLSGFDHCFPAWRWREVYDETFRGLGIRTWQQPNIQLDDAPRPRKHPGAFCSPVRIPDEIRLVFTPAGGPQAYQALLQAAGHAQHFAWTSPQLRPEFSFTGDEAVGETWAILFQSLLLDQQWLATRLGFDESQEFRRTLAVHKLMRVRRSAARLNYEVELHAEKLTGTAGARYAELLSDAVRVKYDETEHLRDLDDGFYSASCLRASAFEAQLREYLKSKYGSRWWESRKAGEMLTDLWNTGNRYSADRLAAMIGLGELSFDWLAEELIKQAQG